MATALAAKPKRKTKVKAPELQSKSLQRLHKAEFSKLAEEIGDIDLTLFFIEWMANSRNATKAYKALHPGISDLSAQSGGSRWLAQIPVRHVMDCYGLGVERYFQQLDEGLKANRKRAEVVDRDDKGRPVYEYFDEEDHRTRRLYHEAQGRMLGLENQKDQAITFNFNTIGTVIQNARKERGLEG